MKRLTLAAALLTTLSVAMTAHAEMRCGIISNSLPGGELTLDDRDAGWNLAAQGVPDKMPDTNKGEQCGCVSGTTNATTHEFTSITAGKSKPMKACSFDAKLMVAFHARYNK